MSGWVLMTEESGYTRHFDAVALPVSIGGDAGCDLVLGEVRGSVQIGLLDGVFFVQPGRATENVRLDGELLQGSRRIGDGNVISLDTARLRCTLHEGRLKLAIEAQVTAGDTAPPDFDAQATDQARETTVSPIAFRRTVQPGLGARARRIRPTALVAYAGFVVLAVLGWFAFTAKSVRFEFTPQAAESFELPGTWFRFELGGRYMLRAGEHRVVAELTGYYPIDRPVDVDANRGDQTIALEFVRLPGLITFATEPEAGAEVRLDGEPIGTTPIEDFEVRPGTHQVRFTAERYLTEVVSLEVEGGHEQKTVRPTLTPSWAPVGVSSVPAGAEIRVDGNVQGMTPAVLELTAGEREIEIALAGYNPVRRQVRVVADEPQTLPEVELMLADGRVTIETRPLDVGIRLNGEYAGQTPLAGLRLRPNVLHRLTLSKPGYETETLEFTLAPGERRPIGIELVEERGRVEIRSEPEGAEVVINGEAVGVTPYVTELQTVEQQIAVRLEGHTGESERITPLAGYPQTLAFQLIPLNAATGAGHPSVVTSGVIDANLILIPGGTFQMGAAPDDAEQRPIEAQRTVEITRAFYLAEHEMTNGQYRAVCDPEHDSGTFDGIPLDGDDRPVVNVTVQEIFDCLNRLSIRDGLQPVYEEKDGILAPLHVRSGYRLATEAEFEWAMRAAGRGDEPPLKFSWGYKLPVPDRFDNLADLSAMDILAVTLGNIDGHAVTAPVGSFRPNAMGLYDMGGNVAEWVQDFYDPLATPAPPGAEAQIDPRGPETGRNNMIRGPGWQSATMLKIRLSYRDFGNDPRPDLGFRIARNL